MSKIIYICSRKLFSVSIKKKLNAICKSLAPDNITPNNPKILINGDIAYAIMNPNNTHLEHDNTLLIGQIFDKDEKWFNPKHRFPDGSYALFRDGKDHCEIVSDPAGSRTIWYYFDENTFISATSQRAIVMFLESFEFDDRVIPWMLSTGSLGPTFSWDNRIKRVPTDSSILLDKSKWSIISFSNPIEFNIIERSDDQHEKLLFESIEATFRNFNLDYSKWVLPLSGGYDSRAILLLLRHKEINFHDLKTITWGLDTSINVKGSDAYVAKELANRLNVPNKYYFTNISTEPIEKIINRFLIQGEGRIDHLAAYMDGFKIWKTLFEDGIQGTIRGDQGFGWGLTGVSSNLHAKLTNTCLCSDFNNLKNYTKYAFPLQELPQQLCKRDWESINTWSDRIYHEYSLSTIMSALSDLKFSYLEQISPFLSRTILLQTRQLPEHLRQEKALFKTIVSKLSPNIEYANCNAEADAWQILRQKNIVNLLNNELSSEHAKTLFPNEFLDSVLKGITSNKKEIQSKKISSSLKSSFKNITPPFIKKSLQKLIHPKIDNNILAFRIFIICKMYEILNNDTKSMNEIPRIRVDALSKKANSISET